MKRRLSWSGRRAAQAWCSTLMPNTGRRKKEVYTLKSLSLICVSESHGVSRGIFNWKTLQLPYLKNASQFNWFSECFSCFFFLICLLKYWNVSCPFFLDFDEQTTDDWDVDMSVYYDKGMLSLFYQIALNEQNWISSGDSNFFFSQMGVTWMHVTMSECDMKKGWGKVVRTHLDIISLLAVLRGLLR